MRRDSWHASFMTRTFLFIAIGMAVISLGLSAVGAFPFDVWWLAFLVAFPAIGIWGWRRFSIGTAELNDRELVVKSRAWTQRYPWEDIVAITAGIRDLGPDAWIFRAMGLDTEKRTALVDLRRQYRQSLVWSRGGTRTLGIPLGEKVQIEVEDVQGFVEAANEYLRAARSSG
ncbi:MAG TPA: hypothetical protein VLS25_00220 [Dehalococcoidia bacterium]|nr:hypothetical protein [Dehalococcoidia bacterium]